MPILSFLLHFVKCGFDDVFLQIHIVGIAFLLKIFGGNLSFSPICELCDVFGQINIVGIESTTVIVFIFCFSKYFT